MIGMRNHDLSIRAVEDSTCLRRRGTCDRYLAAGNTKIGTEYEETLMETDKTG
jgi:hypothetical protein